MARYSAVVLLAFLLFSCVDNSSSLNEIVSTSNGQVKGVLNKQKGTIVFKGIPYAAPPVGDLRWKAPQPHEKWDAVLDCSKFGPAAMQPDPQPFYMWTSEFIAPADRMNEDCLYLNIWTKAISPDKKQPVLMYIHGGGFSSGSGDVPIYNGEAMAQKGVVFVTINYRLGIFGFFSHPQLTAESPDSASGNYGLLDQVAALKWIKENIEAFGGDPNNVTIAGQSAGAFCVNYLVASPLAKGLFHRAIAESGGAVLPTNRFAKSKTLREAEKDGFILAESLEAQDIQTLRSVSAKELLEVKAYTGPIVDGYFLPRTVYEILKEGKQNDVPLLMGWNADEGNFGGPPVNAETFRENSRTEYGNLTSKFLELFPSNTEQEAQASQLHLGSLKTFGLQAFAWLHAQNRTGQAPVYLYHFNRKVPFGEGQTDFGAFHSSEIAYAYGNLDRSTVRPWEKIDYNLEDFMLSYWSQFVKSGIPGYKDGPVWESCKEPELNTMYFGEDTYLEKIPSLKQLSFLQDFYESRLLENNKN